MATQVPPKKNAEFIFYAFLTQQANPLLFQSNPTLAAGDVTVSIDGGAFANLGTLPDVDPNNSRAVKVLLSAAEMNGDNIQVIFSDVSGAQWCDVAFNIQTVDRQVNDLAYPATSGRSLLVNTTGGVAPDWGQVQNPTTAVDLSATQILAADAVGTVVGAVGSVAGDVGGNVTGSVGSLATQAKADVNEQVLDVLNTDVVPEASGVPAATTTVFGMIARLYGALRNSVTVNSGTGKKQFSNDAGAAQWEKDFTDDGTIYNETKGNAP